MNLYAIVLDIYGNPKLHQSAVIKETPNSYLCESRSAATRYRSRVPKSELPALDPVTAWRQYIDRAEKTIVNMRRSLEDNYGALSVARDELRKLAELNVKIGGTE